MVDPDRLDANEDLAFTRLRIGDVLELQNLRPAGLVDDDRAHTRSVLGMNRSRSSPFETRACITACS